MKKVLSALTLALALAALGAAPSHAGSGLLGVGGSGRNHLDLGIRSGGRNHLDLELRSPLGGVRSRLETDGGDHRLLRRSYRPRYDYYSYGYSPYFYGPYAHWRYDSYHPSFYGPYGYSPYYYGPRYGAFYDSYAAYPPPPIDDGRVYVQRSSADQELEQGYWYYCRSAAAYYPKVERCAEDWIAVPPTPRP